MKEQVLVDYLQNRIPVEVLAEDLKGSQQRRGHDVTSVHIDQLQNETELLITRKHLIRLCDEALNGHLTFEDLNTIAFALFTTEHLHRDTADEILEDVLFAWDNPEIGFPLTTKNMKKWKLMLETGNDTFDIRELNRKRKNGA
jgi:hypothetical protein